ncbi:hpt domain protein, partial [Vibrio parahaemolyticus V-223/04]
PARRSFPR